MTTKEMRELAENMVHYLNQKSSSLYYELQVKSSDILLCPIWIDKMDVYTFRSTLDRFPDYETAIQYLALEIHSLLGEGT